jgi:hypothetical protein
LAFGTLPLLADMALGVTVLQDLLVAADRE